MKPKELNTDIRKIVTVGNSLGVTLPTDFRERLGLQKGTLIKITVEPVTEEGNPFSEEIKNLKLELKELREKLLNQNNLSEQTKGTFYNPVNNQLALSDSC